MIKNILRKYLLLVIITLISILLFSTSFQYRESIGGINDIRYDTIYVNELTTTYLIFEDSKVIWANIGNPKQFAVEKNNNTILIRSRMSGTENTNFIIELEDKKFLNGILVYKKELINPVYTYKFKKQIIDTNQICNPRVDYNIEEYNSVGIFKDRILVQLVNIYHDNHSFYFRLKMMNDSKIDYHIDMIKVHVVDSKRKSFKGEIKSFHEDIVIESDNENYIYLCSELEAISERELVYIEIIEKNGFRNFQLIINSKIIQSSKKIK